MATKKKEETPVEEVKKVSKPRTRAKKEEPVDDRIMALCNHCGFKPLMRTTFMTGKDNKYQVRFYVSCPFCGQKSVAEETEAEALRAWNMLVKG